MASPLLVRVQGRGLGRSPIGLPPILATLLTEAVRASADAVTRTWDGTGDLAFAVPANHAAVLTYEARLRVAGVNSVVATEPLGKPTPDGNGVCVVPLAGFFVGRTPGLYTVSVAATDNVGTIDSIESPAFALPLPMPTERLRVSEVLSAVRA